MGRILGIDYGDSRIGLALSDPTKTIASPYQTIANEGEQRLLQKLNNIITEKDTKFIPFYNGKNLFTEINKNITPIIFNKVQLDEFFPNGMGDTIFLGVANTFNYINYYYF